MDLWMKGFDAAIEHFGETRVLAQVFHSETMLAKCASGSASGNQFNAGVRKRLRKGHKAGFVEDGKERPLDFHHG